jgi:phenylpropionate dioxygenase-like ring-hydroxylating dioxygenase large terminal subunit
MSTHIRETGINPNHWYMIAKSDDVKKRPIARMIWQIPVALFRDSQGSVHALEDRCPHRMVRISHGQVVNGNIECPYHGWCFDTAGNCVHIPSLQSRERLPDCSIRSLPVVEKHGFVWIFPGDPHLSNHVQPIEMNEWEQLDQVMSAAKLSCRAHFSFVIENLMDMYHGHLHGQYQTWTVESLKEVIRGEDYVEARYMAKAYYRVDRGSSIFQLFLPFLRTPYSAPLKVTYKYPHWKANLGDEFRLYCLFCPIGEKETEAYLVHFTSLHHYTALNKAPEKIRRIIKRSLNNIAKRLLEGLIRQDVLMVEEEQLAFERQPERRPLELNRTLVAVQKLIRQQASNTANPYNPSRNVEQR